jgi:hypothetical protein
VKVLEAIAEKREFIVAVKRMLLETSVWVRFRDSRRNTGKQFRHNAAYTFSRGIAACLWFGNQCLCKAR